MSELAHADEKSVYSMSVHTDPGVLFSAVYTVRITNSGFPKDCLCPPDCLLPAATGKPLPPTAAAAGFHWVPHCEELSC